MNDQRQLFKGNSKMRMIPCREVRGKSERERARERERERERERNGGAEAEGD